MTLIIRFSNPNRPVEDLEVVTHSNDTLVSIRRAILRRIKPLVQYKLELFINGEALDTGDDRKLLSQIPIRDRTVSKTWPHFTHFVYTFCHILDNLLQLGLVV